MKNLIDIIQEKLILSKQKTKYAEDEYFYHEALEDGYTTKFMGKKNKLQYSIDDCNTWHDLNPNKETPEINKNERIYFKGENMQIEIIEGIGIFSSNKKFNACGNIMSLIYGDNFEGQTELLTDEQFKCLFYENNYLVSAKNLILPATKLTTWCYRRMFEHCTSLIEAPKLPATKLVDSCYARMFERCVSLKEAPELPATELAESCYRGMFAHCSSLIEAPELPATELFGDCYNSMFDSCTSLIKSPVLPATKLAKGCYNWMFDKCKSLKEITMLATDIQKDLDSLSYWVDGIYNRTGTFIKAKGVDIPKGENGIPEGWTVKEI